MNKGNLDWFWKIQKASQTKPDNLTIKTNNIDIILEWVCDFTPNIMADKINT